MAATWQQVDDSNLAIVYTLDQFWESAVLEDGTTYHNATTSFAKTYLYFRGTGVRIHALKLDGPAQCTVNILTLGLNAVGNDCGAQDAEGDRGVIYEVQDLPEDDHLLRIDLNDGLRTLQLDGFEILARGDPLKLQSVGFDAMDVPSEAIIVDDRDKDISYSDSEWTFETSSALRYKDTLAVSTSPGQSFSYAFEGTAIWYYGRTLREATLSILIDGEEQGSVKIPNIRTPDRRLSWSKEGLDPGRHVINVTITEGEHGLDYFRVLNSPSSTSSGSPQGETSTSANNPPSGSRSNQLPVGAIAGIVLGIVALLLVIMAGFLLWRRRKRTKTDKAAGSAGTHPAENSSLSYADTEKRPPVRQAHSSRTHLSPSQPSNDTSSTSSTGVPAYYARSIRPEPVETGRMQYDHD